MFSNTDKALQAARLAADLGGQYFFSGRVQLIKVLIKSKFLNEAEEKLSTMRSDFPNSKNDLKIALQSSLELEKGDALTALNILDGFIDKSSRQYKGIKAKSLGILVNDVSVDYKVRRKFQHELHQLGDYHDFNVNEIDS
jgi:hypothetical protein